MTYSPDHLSQWEDFFEWNPASRHRRRIIAGLLAGREFGSVLDIGCGDGRLLGFLRQRFGCEVYGVESDDSPAAARVKLHGYWKLDISKKGVGRTFDAVVAAEVLEHIPDHKAAMANLAAAARRWVVLTVPGGTMTATDRYMGHVRHYDVASLRALVEGAGCRVLDIFAWGFPFHSLYKYMQDRVPGSIIKGFGSGRYGPVQKAVSEVLYRLFFLNSRSLGKQLFLLAEKP